MKEYPEPNYFVEVTAVEDSIDPLLGDLLPRTYRVGVNLIVSVIIQPWLRPSPWPPPRPTNWDQWKDRDEAAQHLFATNMISIAPTQAPEGSIQSVTYPEISDRAHTVFWLPQSEFDTLLSDVELAYTSSHGGDWRLDELSGRPLAVFLRRELPKAALGAYPRQILCLEHEPDSAT